MIRRQLFLSAIVPGIVRGYLSVWTLSANGFHVIFWKCNARARDNLTNNQPAATGCSKPLIGLQLDGYVRESSEYLDNQAQLARRRSFSLAGPLGLTQKFP